MRAGRRRTPLVAFALYLLTSAALLSGGPSRAAAITVTVDATASMGTLNTQVATQIHYPHMLEAQGTRELFRKLGAPMVRILASSDGCCWPGGPAPMIPAGKVQGSWDFSSLDSVVNDIVSAGAAPVLDIFQAPEWMWNCSAGVVRDTTFAEFGDYMARLVAYYNKGSFVAEDGRTISNPAGVSNRIVYWEIWNEPDLWAIACEPNGSPNISASQYVAMWNATAPKMLAVDPSIKLIGPVAGPQGNATGNYVTSLLVGAVHKPDILSFHGYGGWKVTQTDKELLDGIELSTSALAQERAWAPNTPIWITELNVNSAWGDDPTHRPYNAYGVAWGASAFRRLALGGAGALFQYEFAHPGNPIFQLVDPRSGAPRLPYWREYYLARYFPPGSTLLQSSASLAGIETLAARAPQSKNVHVLVINRQVESDNAVGGTGVPATVQVSLANLSGITQVSLRQLDATTPVASGPTSQSLPVGNTATVNFSGFGAALLEFVAGSPTVSSPPAVPLAPIPAQRVFADGFESGGLSAWTVTGAGGAAAQSEVVHAGTNALSLTSGAVATRDLAEPLPLSTTSFALRLSTAAAGVLASGLDAPTSKLRWSISYDAGALAARVYDDAGTGTELASWQVPLDTWIKVELRYVGTSTGGAELLLDGISRGALAGNYASPSPYQVLRLGSGAPAGTAYFDEVLVTGAVFGDDFESGAVTAWGAITGTGSASIQTGVVHQGTRALALTNGPAQGVWLVTNLGLPLTNSTTSFALRLTSASGGFLAWGRDATSMRQRWALHFNPVSRGLSYIAYDDAGVASEVNTGPDPLPLDTWMNVELRYTGTSTGGAELILDGVSKGTLTGNYASASPYQVLQLGNEAPSGTTYVDDVVVR